MMHLCIIRKLTLPFLFLVRNLQEFYASSFYFQNKVKNLIKQYLFLVVIL
ncbi:hypothetical protein GLYMA_18G033850v4 [Glycine max]|nr:hypothetical protein GLYMA_18G033850v4 [Glycine max]KAH1152997.1 hypothetical protein GYH30_048900 [Glycine max]